MKLLTPLGLLGLISLLILLIIYIIKPNYQQKRISSTFIWKLSLRYRKKKIPISKLRNILIIICQILILTSCAFILAQPNKVLEMPEKTDELIIVLDASASMRSTYDEKTRFERAVDSIIKDYNGMKEEGTMSVIIADAAPHYLFEGKGKLPEDAAFVDEKFDELLLDEMACSYGVSDTEAAFKICEQILKENPDAKIKYYTDTTYGVVPKKIEVVNVGVAKSVEGAIGEWNAGILNARAEYEDNYYAFYVEVACFGKDAEVELTVQIQGANAYDASDYGSQITISESVYCGQDQTANVVFKYFNTQEEQEDYMAIVDDKTTVVVLDQSQRVFSYQSVHLSLAVSDTFYEDDSFDIYGGQKEVMKVLYTSTMANSFFYGAMNVFSSELADRWDIQYKEHKNEMQAPGDPIEEHVTEGYDFYIYEHDVPSKLPTDGFILLVNPDETPDGLGVNFGQDAPLGSSKSMSALDDTHPLLKNIDASKITISMHKQVLNYDPSFTEVLSVDGRPLVLVKNEVDCKIGIFAFSLHYSSIAIQAAFPQLLYNMFQFFLPPTVERNAYEVNETISFNARGADLTVASVTNIVEPELYTEFPAEYTATIPGTYELFQTAFGKSIYEKIYVKIPETESNIWAYEDSLVDPYSQQQIVDFYDDLLIYIAAALVTLLFCEWWLHLREEV